MAENMIKFLRGNVASLPTTATEGALYFTKDEGIYLGLADGKYHRYGDFVIVANVAALPVAGAHETCMYYCIEENILAKYDTTKGWVQINKQPTAEEMKTLLGLGTLAYKSEVVEDDLATELKEKVNAAAEGNHAHTNKAELDKIAEGDKAKWDAVVDDHLTAADKTALEGSIATAQTAAETAQAGVDTLQDTIDNAIEAVTADLDYTATGMGVGKTIKTLTQTDGKIAVEFEDIQIAQTQVTGLEDALNDKVDKAEGKSLIANTEIVRLAGISDGANKVEASTNGKIKIDGVDTVVYTHPDKHAIADVDGLQDALDGKQAAGDYAAAKHTHTAAEITDFADEVAKVKVPNADKADEATKATQDGNGDVIADTYAKKATTLAGYGIGDAYTKNEVNTAVQGAKDYAKVVMTETTEGLDTGIAKKYTFTQNDVEIGTINLAKDLVVTSGSVGEVTEADAPYAGAKVGDKYIELVIANQDEHIYVPAKDLVDIYTAKAEATEVQIAISNTNEVSATIVNGGIAEEKLAEGVKAKLNKTWEEVGVAKGLVDALANGTVANNTAAIATINGTGDGSFAKADETLKTELQTYADTAESDAVATANAYTDALSNGQVAANKTNIETLTAQMQWGEF